MQEEMVKRDFLFDSNDYQIIEYSDVFSVNGDKKLKVRSLGEKFASLNLFFLDYLKEYHIPAAFIKSHEKNSIKFIQHNRFPFYVKILNVVDKRTSKIFSKKETDLLHLPIFEIHYGDGKDSIISESHLISFDLCSNEEIKLIYRICSKVNAVLKSFFERRGFFLAEVNCFYGKYEDKIFLVDDFTSRSLKVFPINKDERLIDPYKLTTSAEIRHYTDKLFNMTSI
ncbi:MAG: phosphoribosylaminoimidazolesuccinocarboxamide synthase [Ignavibacteriaceae bacterium]